MRFQHLSLLNLKNTALLLYVASLPIAGVLNSFIIANIFYNGDVTDLPEDVYGELLSIPTTSMDLSKLSYMEIAHYLVDANVPKGQLFGASAFGTIEQPYRDAFSSFMNFSQTFQTSYESTLIAFTPVLVSQIIAGRQSGGNAIDPPLGGYNALQFQVTFPVGVESVPPELEAGRQIFFRQYVLSFLRSPALMSNSRSPPSPGLPLYINECDETQDVFATYGQYEWLKQTYLKYDPTRLAKFFTRTPFYRLWLHQIQRPPHKGSQGSLEGSVLVLYSISYSHLTCNVCGMTSEQTQDWRPS